MFICVCLFFTTVSFATNAPATTVAEEEEGGTFWQDVKGWFEEKIKDLEKAVLQPIFNKILEWLTKPIIAFGDGILHIIARCVGEEITVDKLIFDDVKKVSINYWEKGEG